MRSHFPVDSAKTDQLNLGGTTKGTAVGYCWLAAVVVVVVAVEVAQEFAPLSPLATVFARWTTTRHGPNCCGRFDR